MKIISHASLEAISGGQAKQLIVTQKEPLTGLSQPCLAVYKDAAESIQFIKDDERDSFELLFNLKLLTSCSLKDFMSSDDDLPFLTVEYK